jgi:hypothetical protein
MSLILNVIIDLSIMMIVGFCPVTRFQQNELCELIKRMTLDAEKYQSPQQLRLFP